MQRTGILSLAAVVVPMALAAQPTAPAPQAAANSVVQSFRAYGSRYSGWLVAAFDSIPASKYAYKPTPVQQTIGYIAQHLEEANYALCAGMSGATRTTTAKDSLADTVKASWPKDTLVARLRASVAYCDNAIGSLTDAQLADEVPVGPPSAGHKIARVRYLLAYDTDLAEHYSQLASYMRLNGLVPPSALPRPSH